MSNSVELPLSIEKTLRRIYEERSIPPLDPKARLKLATVGEEEALVMLQRFRSLDAYISFMVRTCSRTSLFGPPQLDDETFDTLSLDDTRGDASMLSSSSSRNMQSSYLCSKMRSAQSFTNLPSRLNYSYSYMGHSSEIPIPASIDKELKRICEQQQMPPLDASIRKELAYIGEEAAAKMLQRFQNLADYINFTVGISDSVSSQGSISFSGNLVSGSSSLESQGKGRGSSEIPLCCGTAEANPQAMSYLPSNNQDYVLVDDTEGQIKATNATSLSSPRNVNSASLEKPRTPDSTLLAYLGDLEFRKAFLVLTYCGKRELEEVMTVDMVSKMKNLSMKAFESEVWRLIGWRYIKEADRRKNVDWDSGRTYLYRCYINSDATYTFKGPYLQKQRTHLQRVLGDDNVLDVRFAEPSGESNSLSKSVYQMIAREGILVGPKRYHYFVFKDGGKSEKKKNPSSSSVKCYFVCMESSHYMNWERPRNSSIMSVHEQRCVFMHVHMVSSVTKYMARLSLILSKTIKLEIDLALVNVERIDDIPCLGPDGKINSKDGEALIHSDGTGFISEDLALKCPPNIFKGGEFERIFDHAAHDGESIILTQSKSCIREPPLLIQSRLFYNGIAVKGTFLVNKKLPHNTIQIRPSMIKVERDPNLIGTQSANSFEVVSTSSKPRRKTCLSRYLIALLSYGGVPVDFFMELLETTLHDVHCAHSNKRAALKVSLNYGDMDDYLLPRMILCGIPLDEPFLKSRLSVVMTEEKKSLKIGKIPISESYFLIGTADPTGELKDNEVCVILDHGQVSGDVLVYRHPGLHFGDVHVLTATRVKELDGYVGNCKYAIFFPTKRPRSLASEMANGDFDGDVYWVSRNPQLLESYNASDPWIRKYYTKSEGQRKPVDIPFGELEGVLFQQFLTSRFHPSNNIGSAADSWLAFMDRLLILGDDCAAEKQCLRDKMVHLVDVYYDALDAPKTGKKVVVSKELKAEKYPHYMERQNSFRSTSVLGLIYDEVNKFQTSELHSKVVTKLPSFNEEISPDCLDIWTVLYTQYRSEMSTALALEDKEAKEAAADEVIQKYKQILYGAAEFEESPRTKEDIFNDALAIYHLAYDYAEMRKDVGKCSFAWKVAGRALCAMYARKQGTDLIVCQKSVLREILS